MVQGGVRWVFKGVAAVALLILVVGALLAARLSQGPLPLDLLNPYILDIVNDSDADVRFSLGGTELHWGRRAGAVRPARPRRAGLRP